MKRAARPSAALSWGLFGGTVGAVAGLAPPLAAGLAAGAGALAAGLALGPVACAGVVSLASFFSGVAVDVARLRVRPEQAIAPLLLALLLLRRRTAPAPRAAALVALWLAAGVLGALGEPDTGRALVHAARLAATRPFTTGSQVLQNESEMACTRTRSSCSGSRSRAVVFKSRHTVLKTRHLVSGAPHSTLSACSHKCRSPRRR